MLRRTTTAAERKFWYALRAHRFDGLGFRRQVPLGPYILDFVCHDRAFVIEVDGGQHFSTPQTNRDAVHDRWLASQGYRVIRIPNSEVLTNLNGVLEYLLSVTADTPLPPCGGTRSRLARTEGGETPAQKLGRTPLRALPYKGGGVYAAPSVQNTGVRTSSKDRT